MDQKIVTLQVVGNPLHMKYCQKNFKKQLREPKQAQKLRKTSAATKSAEGRLRNWLKTASFTRSLYLQPRNNLTLIFEPKFSYTSYICSIRVNEVLNYWKSSSWKSFQGYLSEFYQKLNQMKRHYCSYSRDNYSITFVLLPTVLVVLFKWSGSLSLKNDKQEVPCQ